jgi:HrpA-like RNA helicase
VPFFPRDGRCFRLITENCYDAIIPDSHEPEMLRAPLDKVILDTKLLNFGPPVELLSLAMTQPKMDNIHKYVANFISQKHLKGLN